MKKILMRRSRILILRREIFENNYYMTINNWLPEYQNRVNESILQYFAINEKSYKSAIELDFFSALRHAVE